MRRILSVALAAVAVLGVSPAVAAAAPGAPTWTPCPAAENPTGRLQCTTVAVPLDYRQPRGRTIDLAVSRLPSAHPAQRRGVLLTNPGGPGLRGVPAPPLFNLPQAVLDTYDVIGFDPRGVGRSAPLDCALTPEQRPAASSPPYPQNAADVARQADLARTIARQCTTSPTADLRPYVSTANTARDMDRIRAALGAPTISYYGESYGTYLGAVYRTLFPQHSDRVVLDSSLPPEGYDRAALRSQAAGFQQRFPDFARFAAADPARYGLGTTPAAVTAKYYDLAGRFDRQPQSGVDGTAFRSLTALGLRADKDFAGLADLWHQLDQGQVPAALAAAGSAAATTGGFAEGYLGVVCGDTRWPRSVASYQRDVAVDRVRYPMYGAYTANIRPCAFWPAPTETPVRIAGSGPADVLILQNLRDPATPLPGALRTRWALGPAARMVAVDQGGHVAYGAGNRCGNDAVTDYLVSGRYPTRDTFCPAEKS